MNRYGIIASDIMGSKGISINTPIIILYDVPCSYLIPRKIPEHAPNEIKYLAQYVDIDKLHNDLGHTIHFIEKFYPLGQIVNSYAKTFNLIMANTRIISTTNIFEEISPDIWIGVVRKDDKISRSLGTIYSIGKPTHTVPVFPSAYLKKNNVNLYEKHFDSIYKDLYSSDKYGSWMLNKYKFNVDKTNLKMIDTTGEINNMFIPSVSTVANDNRRIYYNARGDIVSDTNCIPSVDDAGKTTLNECSGFVAANDDDVSYLDNNLNIIHTTKHKDLARKNRKLLESENKNKKALVLKEKDEPWFLDSNIVGNASYTPNPHKITGFIESFKLQPIASDLLPQTDLHHHQYPIRSGDKLNSKNDDDNNNINTDDENINENSETNYNNIIMYFMCIVIIFLLIYKNNK
jgi:hypothetical protein